MIEQSTFQLQIVTPEKIAFSENVNYAIFPGADGDLGVLPHHAALLSELAIGAIAVTIGATKKVFAISGGFLEVRDNSATVVADTVEAASEIDVARAQKAQESAMHQAETGNDYDKKEAELRLKRSLNRLKIASSHS